MITFNLILTVILFFIYSYQFVFIFLTKRKGEVPKKGEHLKIAVLIPASNEEDVIGRTVKNLLASKYPRDSFTVFVLSDNSHDDTSLCAEEAGATVYTRTSDKRGKGYALDYLITRVKKSGKYDAYAVLDADNTVSEDFLSLMSDSLSEGYDVAVGCRIPENFGESLVASLSGMCFLYEAVYLNRGRFARGSMPFVLGTGFVFSDGFLSRMGAWRFFSLTEDFEMCAYMALHGVRVRYTEDAVFFDPQPCYSRDSRAQRMRWTRGGGEVMRKFLPALFRMALRKPSLAVFDVLLSFAPAFIFAVLICLSGAVGAVLALLRRITVRTLLISLLVPLSAVYSALFMLGMYMLREKKLVRVGTVKKILYSLAFPLFIFSFFPIGTLSLLKKRVEWRKISRNSRKKRTDY